jgi:hypothetical protein
MIITIAVFLIYILLGICCYIFSFINGAIFVDYALGVFAVINGIITIMCIGLVEKNRAFTKNFMNDISKIKIIKDNKGKEEEDIKQIKGFIYSKFIEGTSEGEILAELINSGITQNKIDMAISELIKEGLVQKVEKVEEEKQINKNNKKTKKGK